MTKREQEVERIEKIIRDLLKLPANKRCINCNSLGPQYVCTTFCTFICTTCSGIHREFTHRVKSISMAKFSAEEVVALKAGGNERGRQIYFKEWDPQRHHLPDGSNLNRLRDFVKHVYEDRRFTGERSRENVSKLRMSCKQDNNDNRTSGEYRSRMQSPQCKIRHERSDITVNSPERRNVERTLKYYFEKRMPSFKENYRSGIVRGKSASFEVVDDRFRDNEMKSRKIFDLGSAFFLDKYGDGSSKDCRDTIDQPLPTTGSTEKQLQRDKSMPSKVVEPSKPTEVKDIKVSEVKPPQLKSSSSDKKSDENPAKEQKSQPDDRAEDSNNEKIACVPSVMGEQKIEKSKGDNSLQSTAPQAPKRNTIEFLLNELSIPVVETSELEVSPSRNEESTESAPGTKTSMSENGFSTLSQSPMEPLMNDTNDANQSLFGNSEGSSYSSEPDKTLLSSKHLSLTNDAVCTSSPSGRGFQVLSLTPADHPVSNVSSISSVSQTGLLTSEGSNSLNETVRSSSALRSENGVTVLQAAPNRNSASNIADYQPISGSGSNVVYNDLLPIESRTEQLSASSKQLDPRSVAQDKQDFKVDQHPVVKLPTRHPERKELPENLFNSRYPPPSAAFPVWSSGSSSIMGPGNQHYSGPMPGLSHVNMPRSSNPFDSNNAYTSLQTSQFLSSENINSPNFATLGTATPIQGTNIVGPTSRLMQPQAAFVRTPQFMPRTPTFPGGNMTNQTYPNLRYYRPQVPNWSPNNIGPVINPFTVSPQASDGYNSLGKGGNPFG